MATSAADPFLARTAKPAGGREVPYAVWLPPGYTVEREWPAMLFLHGMGERGVDGKAQTRVGIGPALRESGDRIPIIVVLPQCAPDGDWGNPAMEEGALAALDGAAGEFRVDPARVYLTGISMGGIGAFRIGARHADRFAAVVPVCGIGQPPSQVPALADVPVWVFHGAEDPAIPVACSRDMVEALRAAGGTVRYTEYEGVGHDSWTRAYAEPELYTWLLSHDKPPPPAPGRVPRRRK